MKNELIEAMNLIKKYCSSIQWDCKGCLIKHECDVIFKSICPQDWKFEKLKGDKYGKAMER